MIISYKNDFDNYSVTASSEKDDYPVENVQQEHLSLTWRSTTSLITQTVSIDTSTTLQPKSVYMAGTNLTNNAIVKIQASTTSDFAVLGVDVTLTKKEDVYYTIQNFGAFRYWRFQISDATNLDGYIEVGRMWLSDNFEVEGPSITFAERRINNSSFKVSLSGQTYGNMNYVYRQWDMSYPWWESNEKTLVEEYADYVNKSIQHFVHFSDETDCSMGPYYVIMTNDMQFDHIKNINIWSSQLSYREVF